MEGSSPTSERLTMTTDVAPRGSTSATNVPAATGQAAPSTQATRSRILGWGLLALAAALAANSIVGPFVADMVDYPVSDTMLNQTIGLDAASLLVVAPIIAMIGVLALRQHSAAPVLALGPTGYVAYMFVQYVVGPDHLSYPPVLMLQLGLFAAGWMLAGLAWRLDTDTEQAIAPSGEPSRRWPLAPGHAWVSLTMGAFVLLRYVPGLIGSLSNEPVPDELAADPAMYWVIVLLDLGVYVPAAVLAAIGLRRGAQWAERLHRGLVGWFLLTTIAVGTMSLVMRVNDDPSAAVGQLVLFIVTGLIVAAYTASVLRPTLRS